MRATRTPRTPHLCCLKCNTIKPISAFVKNARRIATGGYERTCKTCNVAYQKEYRNRPEARARIQAYDKKYRESVGPYTRRKQHGGSEGHKLYVRFLRLRRRYGVTEKQFGEMLAEQKGCCPICGVVLEAGRGKASMVVDHDHKTNAVRGLICRSCNGGIGFLQDDIRIVENALAYLRRYS